MCVDFAEKFTVYATCVSNDFLDHYMADANGDYVKVYLYMLRHRDGTFSVKEVADALNLTDNDIDRAVRYWEKQGLLSQGVSQSVEKEIHAEQRFAASEEVLERAEDAARQSRGEAEELDGTLDQVRDSEEFAGILFVAKHVLPALPTQKQVKTLAYMYEELSMSADLIEFLLEYCAGLEKTSPRYLETVAMDWHQDGIRTVSEAKNRIRAFEQKKTRRSTRKPKNTNKFLNFEAPDIDYDSIVQKKVLERMQNVT